MLGGGKPPFPICEFSPLDWLRLDGVIIQQNQAIQLLAQRSFSGRGAI
jgi:hypothetical protein